MSQLIKALHRLAVKQASKKREKTGAIHEKDASVGFTGGKGANGAKYAAIFVATKWGISLDRSAWEPRGCPQQTRSGAYRHVGNGDKR